MLMFEGTVSAVVRLCGLRIVKGAALLLTVLVVMATALYYFRNYGEDVALRLTNQLIPPLTSEVGDGMVVAPSIAGLRKVRLLEQFHYLQQLKLHHFMALRLFYANLFVCISMAMVAGFLGTACLALITRDGWSQTSGWIQVSFILFAALAVYYTALPKLFRQEENISENKQLFVTYSNLQQDILTLVRVGCVPPKESKDDCVAGFIGTIDARIQAVNRIAIGFDSTGLVRQTAPLSQALAGK